MAKIKVAQSIGFNLDALRFDELFDGLSYTTTSTSFIVNYGAGDRDEFRGIGLTYTPQGVPIAGTVTSYKMIDAGLELASITGASVKVSDIVKVAQAPSATKVENLFKSALAKNDKFEGGGLLDIFNGYKGNDKLFGNGGGDILDGGDGNDTVDGGAGGDTLKGGTGDDKLYGRAGNDTMQGNAGNDLIDGGKGEDVIDGNSGSDDLRGGDGNDTLNGGNGKDMLAGGLGADSLTGGGKADTFIFKARSDSTHKKGGMDKIADFRRGEDKIDVSAIKASGGNDLAFIADDSFSRTAGEIRYERKHGEGTFVYGDMNGDGAADFAILLVKTKGYAPKLSDGDFVL